MSDNDYDFAAEYKRLVSDELDYLDYEFDYLDYDYEPMYKKEGRSREHTISKNKTLSLMEHTAEKKKKNFTRESVRHFNYD